MMAKPAYTVLRTQKDLTDSYAVLTHFHKRFKVTPPSRAVYLRQLKAARKNGLQYLGCKVNGELVGVAGLNIVHDPYYARPYAVINNLIVVPNQRGNGYGVGLLKFCHQVAKRHKVVGTMLGVDKREPKNKKLYTKNGYTQVADWFWQGM